MHTHQQRCRPALVAIATLALTCAASHAAPLRPTTITWGGYCHNEQLIGADDQWTFVQRYSDGYLMHGMYWINKRDFTGPVPDKQYLQTLEALGSALSRYHKTAAVETGLGSSGNTKLDPADPQTRDAYKAAQLDIAAIRDFAKAGVTVSKVRPDWFPWSIAAVYADHYQNASTKDLLCMITGDDKHWGSPAGFDPALGNWREYTRLIGQAFPGMQFGFDQAPCNFYKVDPDPAIRPSVPWPGLGYGYKLDPLKTMYTHKTVLVDGQPVQLNVDFADLIRTWITLAKVDDASGGSDQRNFAAQALRYIRMTGRERSGPRGYQIAEIGVYGPDAPGADQYIAESWYHGPYTLVPETRPGTFTNLARDLVRRVKGIDNTGAPYAANLSVQMPGTTVWQGDGAYDTSGSGSKSIETHSDGAPIDFVVRVRNDGREINPGDCRATMLVRAEEEGGNGWTVRYMADGKDVASDILAKGDADGWFAGGLNPGQSKTFQVEIVPSASPATGDRHSVRFALYWNPQDPLLRARDAITLTVAKR